MKASLKELSLWIKGAFLVSGILPYLAIFVFENFIQVISGEETSVSFSVIKPIWIEKFYNFPC